MQTVIINQKHRIGTINITLYKFKRLTV